uniref:FBA_2 domain-containing protein n=1 Tax=Steinernema glaseri TaxID=37863 RepID=A0A1I7ZD12_9BILA
MNYLPFLFYEQLAAQLEWGDLNKLFSKLVPSTLTKVCRVHLENRQTISLRMLYTEGGQWMFSLFSSWKPGNRMLTDLTKYEYVDTIVVANRVNPFYCPSPFEDNAFYWKDSLEKILRILPRYLRRAEFRWNDTRNNDEFNRKFCDVFLGSGLASTPFVEVRIPHVSNQGAEFLKRQVSFQSLQKLQIGGTTPPAQWESSGSHIPDCIEELLWQPQLKHFSANYVCEVTPDIVRTLFLRWKSSKFSLDLYGNPTVAREVYKELDQWSFDSDDWSYDEWEQEGRLCRSWDLSKRKSHAGKIRFMVGLGRITIKGVRK